MRTAYDSTSSGDIPGNAAIVAGYLDGIYRWSGADWARFPSAIKVGIACFATTDAGQVLDIETGCSTPAQAPSWVVRRRAAGVDPTVYVNRSNWALTRACFIQQGVPEPHYWLASYDGVAEVPAGCVAKQYADSAMAGGHYDLSAVADHWPGVDPSTNANAATEVIPQEADLSPTEQKMLQTIYDAIPRLDLIFRAIFDQPDPNQPAKSTHGLPTDIKVEMDQLKADVATLKASGPLKVTGTLQVVP